MKKLLFVFTMPEKGQYVGGVATVINNYLLCKEQFANNGYSVSLFDYRDASVNRIKFAPLKKLVYGINQAKKLIHQINEKNIDVVHIHTSRNSLFIKDVFLGSYLAKRSKTKICLTVHVGDIATVYDKIPSFLKSITIKLINKYFFKVYFLTEQIRNQFNSNGLKESKSCVLYNSCNITVSKDVLYSSEDKINVLFVGMINRDKGILELLDAIADPNIKNHVLCHICGEITDNSIKDLFEEKYNNVKDYTFLHGYVSGSKKEELFSCCDILVLPSYHEGFPIVILEGITCGCAIVATRVGAIPEILNENNCVFVEIGSSQSLVSAFYSIIRDRELLEKMKSNNRMLSKQFTLSCHIDRLCKSYG